MIHDLLNNIELLKDGQRLNEKEAEILLLTNDILSSNLLDIEIYNLVKCVDSQDKEFAQLTVNQRECRNEIEVTEDTDFIICDQCGKSVNLALKNQFTERRLLINYGHIEIEIGKILNSHGFLDVERCTWERDELTIEYLVKNGNTFPLSLISNKKGYLVNEQLNTNIDFWNLNIWLFLFYSFDEREEWFEGIDFTFNNSLFPTDDEIELYLNKNLDGEHYTVFEKWYAEFLSKVGTNAERFKAAINFLEKIQSSLLGALTVRVGENLEADTRTFPKLDYYRTLLGSIQVGDTKLYSEGSKVTIDHFRQLLDYGDQNRGAIISLGNGVASSVWSRVFYYKDKRGTWDFIIITRKMLKELISLFLPSLIDPERFSQ